VILFLITFTARHASKHKRLAQARSHRIASRKRKRICLTPLPPRRCSCPRPAAWHACQASGTGGEFRGVARSAEPTLAATCSTLAAARSRHMADAAHSLQSCCSSCLAFARLCTRARCGRL